MIINAQMFGPEIHTIINARMFGPEIHTIINARMFGPEIHTIINDLMFGPEIHTVINAQMFGPEIHTIINAQMFCSEIRTIINAQMFGSEIQYKKKLNSATQDACTPKRSTCCIPQSLSSILQVPSDPEWNVAAATLPTSKQWIPACVPRGCFCDACTGCCCYVLCWDCRASLRAIACA
jgi:hypothetical protein